MLIVFSYSSTWHPWFTLQPSLVSLLFSPLKSLSVSFLGERTFGVLTKLDLMDKGTNALDVNFLTCFTVSSCKLLRIGIISSF